MLEENRAKTCSQSSILNVQKPAARARSAPKMSRFGRFGPILSGFGRFGPILSGFGNPLKSLVDWSCLVAISHQRRVGSDPKDVVQRRC